MLPAGENLGGLIRKAPKPTAPAVPNVFAQGSIPGLWFGSTQTPAAQPQGNPYAGLMDSYMSQFRADTAGQSAADKAGMLGALRRYVTSYGAIPDFSQMGLTGQAKAMLNEALTPEVRALAAKNTAEGTSVKARMDEANAKAQRLIPAQLAARGILRSGQTGADLNQQAMDAKRGQFDVLNEMLGNVEGRVSAYAQAEAARQRALADAEMQARMSAMQDWGGSVDQGPVAGSPYVDINSLINPNFTYRPQNPFASRATPRTKMSPAIIAGLRGKAMARFYGRR